MSLSVSVVIPVYKRLEFINDALASIYAQSRPINHVYVMATEPQTHEAIKDYFPKDNLIYSLYIRDVYARKLNAAFEISPDDTIFVLNDDDMIASDFVEKCSDAMEKYNADIVYTDMEMFGIEQRFVRALDWRKETFQVTTAPFGTSLMKRAIGKQIKYQENMAYLDWDFWWSAFEAGFTAYHLEEYLFLYRTHPEQWSRTCDTELETKKVKEHHGYT